MENKEKSNIYLSGMLSGMNRYGHKCFDVLDKLQKEAPEKFKDNPSLEIFYIAALSDIALRLPDINTLLMDAQKDFN